MKGFAFLLAAFLSLAGPLAAQQISVRSGEHADFARLVFMFPPGTSWNTERVPGGYRLVTPYRDTRFDLSNVFRFIPKTRVLSVAPDLEARSLFIETAPTVRLETFQLAIGAAVLDFIDGPEDLAPSIAGPPAPSYLPSPDRSYLDLYWARPRAAASAPASPAPAAPAPPPSAPAAVSSLDLPDPRIRTAETELIDQLGRAASQGLITMELPKSPRGRAEKAPEPAAEAAEEAPVADGALALQSETVIDRDTAATKTGGRLSDSGHSCPQDDEFDVLAWVTDKKPAEQISDARKDLVGEFDKPQSDGVYRLARTYVALGFGAEAKAVLRSFGTDPESDKILGILADVVDGRAPEHGEALAAMAACDGKVALWAVLSAAQAPRKGDVNFGAIVRAYSALPPNVREIIGPRLSERLIEIGAPDVAATVRSMLARAPVNTKTALKLMDAQIGLQEGHVAEATALLDEVANSGSLEAARSLALSIETKLSQGMAIAAGDVENASALGRQLKGTETGDRLARAEVLGLGSTAQFDAAFDALKNWRVPSGSALRDKTQDELLAMLAGLPDDQIFIETYFRHRGAVDPAAIGAPVQIRLADRLSANGFWQSARGMIAEQTRKTEAGRMALARAALAGRDASAAFSHLAGLDGEDVAKLRGEALSMLGRHDTAEEEFARAGVQEALVDEAWRSGNWSLVAAQGSENQKKFLELFAALPESAEAGTGSPPLGPLAEAQRLIAQSESEREAFAKIMQDLSAE